MVEKVNTKHFKYSLQFGSIIYELSKIQLLFPDAENKLTVSEGNPIGNADLLIGHVLNNANRLQNGWTKGTVIETEAKQVDFSEDNCLSASLRLRKLLRLNTGLTLTNLYILSSVKVIADIPFSMAKQGTKVYYT